MRTVLVWVACLLGGLSLQAQVLYNVDFNSPAQPVNSLVRTGAPPNFISRINYGSPTVVGSFGGLTDQPLQLDMVNNAPFHYDQIQLNLSPAVSSSLDISFDFCSAGLIGSPASGELAVLLDAVNVNAIYFDSLGNISLWPTPQAQGVVGSFVNGEVFHFTLHLDRTQQQWSAYKNGTLLGTRNFSDIGPVYDIRFSYGANSFLPADSSAVAIDNVVVSAVPEPASVSLIALAMSALFYRRHKRGTKRE